LQVEFLKKFPSVLPCPGGIVGCEVVINLNPEIGTTDCTDDTDFKALGAKILLTHWVRWREAGRHSEISESVQSGSSVVPPSAVFRINPETGLGFLTQRRKGAEDAELRSHGGPENVHPLGAPLEPRTLPHSSALSAALRLCASAFSIPSPYLGLPSVLLPSGQPEAGKIMEGKIIRPETCRVPEVAQRSGELPAADQRLRRRRANIWQSDGVPTGEIWHPSTGSGP